MTEKRRPEKGKKTGGGGDKKSKPQKSQVPKKDPRKKLWEDITEQSLDSAMGPIFDTIIGGIPDRYFENENVRRLLKATTWLGQLGSVLIGQWTDAPNWVDGLRTRGFAAYADRINQRLKGESLKGEKPSTKLDVATKPLQYAITNLSMFLLRLDETEWAAWQAGMSELDEAQRKRLITMFSGMKDKHVEKLVSQFRASSGGIDWGQFFGILNGMGILPTSEAGKKDSKDRADETLIKILTLNGDEADSTQKTIINFLEYLADKISRKAHNDALNLMAEWEDEQFIAFAKLESDQKRAGALLGLIASDELLGEKFATLKNGLKKLLELANKLAEFVMDFAKKTYADWIKRQETKRAANAERHDKNQTQITEIWEQINPSQPAAGGGES